MRHIKLTAIEDEFDDYEDEFDGEKGLNFEFDLDPYLTVCAIACGILFVVRFVQKHFLKK